MKLIDLLEQPTQHNIEIILSEDVEKSRPLTLSDINMVKGAIEQLYTILNIDVNFTRHFIDRVNDPRNRKQITVQELFNLFKKIYAKYGNKLKFFKAETEAVMKDLSSSINVPFVIKWDNVNKEIDLIAKTIMRKPGFTTPDRVLQVEAILYKGIRNEKS